MARDMATLRNVGGTLVVTLTQAIRNSVELKEHDRLLLETISPHRVMITKELETMPSSRRTELELQVLEKREEALRQEIHFVVEQQRLGMPLEIGLDDSDIVSLTITHKQTDIANLEVAIAEKQLELFEIQGQ